MLGPGTAGELALAGCAGCSLRRAARCADGSAIKDRPAPLNSHAAGGRRCGRGSGRHNRSLVDGPGAGLRHDNPARGGPRLRHGRGRRGLGNWLSFDRDELFGRCHFGKLCFDARWRFDY
jgi:hypothetical protein